MIDLYISTKEEISSMKISQIIFDQGIREFQVFSYISGEKTGLEYGFHIKCLKIENFAFLINVWNPLKKILDLECAFIKVDNDYMGCILNWPNITTISNCQQLIQNGIDDTTPLLS